MKKVLLFITIAASCVFARSASKTHDGFFLNLSLGMGFQSIDFVVDDYQEDPSKASGSATDLDIKIGGRIMNNLLLHATLAGNTLTTSVNISDDEEIKTTPNMSLFGIGATYYFPENFLATASFGVAQFHANENVTTFYASVASRAGNDINTGLGFQIGGGKEWWIANEWGIGATASILYGFASNKSDANESSFAISLRLSVTYN